MNSEKTLDLLEKLKLPELTFEDDSHTYKLKGTVIPSVTTIMNPLTMHEYAGISDSTLNNAANKGTIVHNSIENYIKFEMIDVPKEYEGYFKGFLEWNEKYKPEFAASEVKVYHKLMRYGGTIDMLVFIDGVLYLVDIKTTYNLIEKSCGVQLEAYLQALKSLGINVERKAILHLKKDGKWEFTEFPMPDLVRLRVFDGLKRLYDYMQS